MAAGQHHIEGTGRMRFGVFIYPGTEPIDLATFGVLSMARRIAPQIEIVTIAPDAGVVTLANGLDVIAQCGVSDAPACDVLIVTGGPGWPEQAASSQTLAFLQRLARARANIVSVCTGAMILAASGALDGRAATTKRRVVDPEASPLHLLEETYPDVHAVEASIVEDRNVVTGGGVSLCIDATLYAIAKWVGADVARDTARLIEYDRALDANADQFPRAHPGKARAQRPSLIHGGIEETA